MKKFLAICASILCCANLSVNAETFGVKPDLENKTLTLSLDNHVELTAANFDILLPKGVEVATKKVGPKTSLVYNLVEGRTQFDSDKIGVTVAQKGEGWYRVVLYKSGDMALFTVDDCDGIEDIMVFNLTISEEYTGGAFGVSQYVFAGSGGIKITPEDNSVFLGEATTEISAAGYATFCCTADVIADNNCTVYFGEIDGDVLNLVKSEGNKIPAGSGVILKGTGVVTLTAAPAPLSAPAKNDLIAAEIPFDTKPTELVPEGYPSLVLANGEDGIGFYNLDINDGTGVIPMNHAYILKSKVSATRLRIMEDETNAIEAINAEQNVTINYNLMGHQTKSQNGFVIENGKKVVRF